MVGVLALYAEALTDWSLQRALLLLVLRSKPGRMLTRAQLRARLPRRIPKNALGVHLHRLEKAGQIVVDREEEPHLYGVLP